MENKNFIKNPFEAIKSNITKELHIKEKNKSMEQHLNQMNEQIKKLKK